MKPRMQLRYGILSLISFVSLLVFLVAPSISHGSGFLSRLFNQGSSDTTANTTGPVAITYTWTGAVSNDWFTPGNWSPNGVPGTLDTAIIANEGVAQLSTNTTIANLGVGNCRIFGAGTLNITGSISAGGGVAQYDVNVNVATLNLTSSGVGGSGTMTVTTLLNWTGGGFGGTGKTVVAAGATGSITNSVGLTRQLDNHGSLEYFAGINTCCGVVNNFGTFNFKGGSLPTFGFTNTGTLIKSDATTSDMWALHNNGTVQINSGTFGLSGIAGTSTGSFVVAAGARFAVGATHHFTSTSTITGPGEVILPTGSTIDGAYTVTGLTNIQGGAGGTSFNTNVAIPNIVMTGNGITGTGTVTITGHLEWSGGGMGGTGKTVIAAGATANITNSVALVRQLDNFGSIEYFAGINTCCGIINNHGSFNHKGGNLQSFGFTNTGTLIKSGTATSEVWTLQNNGSVQINSGIFQLGGAASTSTGSFAIASGARLNLARTHNFTSTSSINGAGDVSFEGQTSVSVNGAYTVTGVTYMSGNSGGYSFNSDVTIPNLVITGNGIMGTGTVTISKTFDWTGGGMIGSGKTVIGKDVVLNQSNVVCLSRRLDNYGTINFTAANFSCGGDPFVINNHGVFDIKSDTFISNGLFNNSGLLVKSVGTGTFQFNVPLHNSGTVESKSGLLLARQAFVQTAGKTVLNGGEVGSNGTIEIKGGSLLGSGEVKANVVNSGLVSPGLTPTSTASLNISGTYTQTPTGTLQIELGGTTPGTQFDQLILGTGSLQNSAALHGILNVNLIKGFVPEENASFQISRFNNHTGDFGAINGLAVGAHPLQPVFSNFDLVLKSGTGPVSQAKPWADIIGPNVRAVRGQPMEFRYTVVAGNSGGADAIVPIMIVLPGGARDVEVEGILNRDGSPGSAELRFMPPGLTLDEQRVFREMPRIFEAPVNQQNRNKDSVDPRGLSESEIERKVPAIMILQGGSRNEIRLFFTSECHPGEEGVAPRIEIGRPLVDSQAWNCMTSFVSAVLSRVPGLPCVKLAFSTVTGIGRALLDPDFGINSNGFQSVGAATWLFSFAWNTAHCTVSVIPGLALAGAVVDLASRISLGNNVIGTFANCGPAFGIYDNTSTQSTTCVSSIDPNAKFGSDGVGVQRFIDGTGPLKYLITFENKPIATAPAQEVVITDQLDPATMDLNTFQLGSFSFGELTVKAPPSASAFITDVDLRPTKNLIVRINAALDKQTGLVTWRFTSLDPATGELPEDPLLGFLPANQNPPEGEGSVSFTIMPKTNLPSGTEIRNRASIVFDFNAAIDTGEWLNTIDNGKPSSQVQSLPAQSQPSFEVRWSGTDAQSGIQNYTVFVSENGGPYSEWQLNTSATSAVFAGQVNKTYTFYSIARDGSGIVEDAPSTADATTSTSTSGSVVQFSAAFLNVTEACTIAPVTVTRSGDLTGVATVEYSTTNGSASDRRDYNVALGLLRFAPGEVSKTINVLINDDAFVEGNENLFISLSNPTAAVLGTQSSATVEIIDNTGETGGNALNDPQTYVCQQYHDFLNRQPDAAGLQFWANEITQCGADAQCLEVRSINVSAAFFLSIEFQETGYLVYRLHQATNAMGPLLTMREFLIDTQEIGRNVIVGAPGWEAQLEANKQAFVSSFVARQSFLSLFPVGMSAAEFVDKLNLNTGSSLSQLERDDLVGRLSAGTLTRGQAIRAVAQDPDFNRREFNNAFVYMQYIGYLRRNANETPDTNLDGYNFWLGKLNQFNGNFVNAEMVKAFLLADEYRSRFGQ